MAAGRGTIRVFGLDPARSRDRIAIRRLLGYLPQETGLYPGFSGFDLVDYVAVLKEIKDSRRAVKRFVGCCAPWVWRATCTAVFERSLEG